MSAPPGRRSAPGKAESAPEAAARLTSPPSMPHVEVVALRHGLNAVYIRDTELSIATRRLRRLRRNGTLNAEQSAAYENWLAEQRQDVS